MSENCLKRYVHKCKIIAPIPKTNMKSYCNRQGKYDKKTNVQMFKQKHSKLEILTITRL